MLSLDLSQYSLVKALINGDKLTADEFADLLSIEDNDIWEYIKQEAVKRRKQIYSNKVYTRGLIEISNYCKNDCFYCGIRKSNHNAVRYRLTPNETILCSNEGYGLGYRTFVLQGGEDPFYSDDILVDIIKTIKTSHPDCAITLSLGERSLNSFQKLFDAGADRYLLRHETADELHYSKLHPPKMSFFNRMNCLNQLREIGYQVGVGFMVGSPFQTNKEIGKDLYFIQSFEPDMCGIGPFITHKDTPFKDFQSGSLNLTLKLISIIRLIKPNILLPATTALGTIHPTGREQGILAGANVVMPNLSPVSVRKKYALYDGKICTGEESAQCVGCLGRRMESIGYEIVCERGDIIK